MRLQQGATGRRCKGSLWRKIRSCDLKMYICTILGLGRFWDLVDCSLAVK